MKQTRLSFLKLITKMQRNAYEEGNQAAKGELAAHELSIKMIVVEKKQKKNKWKIDVARWPMKHHLITANHCKVIRSSRFT